LKLTFTILGDPCAKARHRSTRTGRMYNPQSAEDAASMWIIQKQLSEQAGAGYEPTEKALSLAVEAVFVRPKSHYGTGRNAGKLKPSAPVHHVKVPDLDNIVKRVSDLMNAIVYKDDSQIVQIVEPSIKRYGKKPRVIFTITELE